jgi:hypothetical protein
LLSSPSFGISSFTGVKQIVHDAKDSIHAGLPATNFGPPVSLFNRALGLFDYRLCHLDDESSTIDPPSDLVTLAYLFIGVTANSYSDEFNRVMSISGILNMIFDQPSLDWDSEVSQTMFGLKLGAINLSATPFFIGEVKNEASLDGDASLQAVLSDARIATSPVNKVKSFYVCCHRHSFVFMWIVGLTDAIKLSCSLRYHG